MTASNSGQATLPLHEETYNGYGDLSTRNRLRPKRRTISKMTEQETLYA